MMESWKSGQWNIYHYAVDLFQGLANLTAAYEKYANQACAVRYEDLLTSPEGELQRIFTYLELPFDVELLSRFSNVKLKGRVRDKNMDQKEYQILRQAPLEKWRCILGNPIRKAWCRRYLHWIGSERLALMGYDLEVLLAELDTVPFSLQFLGSDMWRFPYGIAYHALEFRMIKHKLEDLRAGRQVYIHT